MPPKAESSTAYRDRVDDDDDDDLDDLDDVLASFNAPKSAAQPTTASSSTRSEAADLSASMQRVAIDDGEGEEDFEASLAEGMESLLRQLAGDNPPGPMADDTGAGKKSSADSGTGKRSMGAGGPSGLSEDDEEKAFQRAIEMLLSKEGIDALGLEDDPEDDNLDPKSNTTQQSGKKESTSSSKTKAKGQSTIRTDPASFEETIRRAMESLNTADTKKPGPDPTGGIPSDPAELAKLLAQLGNDPNLDLQGDDELSGILDGMMGQLLTREVLEEPMTELASKYPGYLASPPPGITPQELETYKQQSKIVQTIVATFRKPGYSDDNDGKEIARLVGEMQDLGGPPKEIMGDLPEGFDLGALTGDDESCTIM